MPPDAPVRRSPALRSTPRRVAAFAVAATMVAVLPACSKKDPSLADFCHAVKQAPSLESVVSRYTQAESDELATRLATARRAYRDLVDASPDDIHDDVAKVVDLVDVVIDAVKAHPTDSTAVADQLRTNAAKVKGAEAATTRVDAYATKHCGFDLDTATTGTDTGGSTVPATTGTTVVGAESTTTTG